MVNAASAELTDVNNAISAAKDGDTVLVPAGTATWTAPIDTAKDISITGATTITGTRDAPVVNDATIIIDNVARGLQAPMLIRSTTPLGKSFRLSGITFRKGSLTQIADNGGIRLSGFSHAVRVDHCHFDGLYQNPNISTNRGCVYGVVDHCVFDLNTNNSESFSVQHDAWGGSGEYGDGSWADDSYFGTEKFLFIEDCTFNRTKGGGLDCYSGGRYVARYNRFNNMGTQVHGTETTHRHRSGRAVEVYNNTFSFASDPHAGELRGGGLLVHDNTWLGVRIEHGISLTCYRQYYPFWTWGAASGANPLDSNDPKLYLSGKAGGGSGANILVMPDAGWTPSQWVGYSAINLTQTFSSGAGKGAHPASWIQSNTTDTIKVKSDGNIDGPATSFAAGDQFEIRKVLIALDQPGRGKGALINGDDPGTAGVTWPGQALDPIYSWNNKRSDGSSVDVVSAEPTIVEGRDYFNNTAKPGYTPYAYPHPLTATSERQGGD